MAFFGLVCGMFVGAIASVLGILMFDIPLWVGFLTYSAVGSVTMMSAVLVMFVRNSDDDDGQMPAYDHEAFLDKQWMEAARGQAAEKPGAKVA